MNQLYPQRYKRKIDNYNELTIIYNGNGKRTNGKDKSDNTNESKEQTFFLYFDGIEC